MKRRRAHLSRANGRCAGVAAALPLAAAVLPRRRSCMVLKIACPTRRSRMPPYAPRLRASTTWRRFSASSTSRTSGCCSPTISISPPGCPRCASPPSRRSCRCCWAIRWPTRMARAPAAARPLAADARHPAVLDLVPDPHLCLDGDPQAGRHPEPVPARVSAWSPSPRTSSAPNGRSIIGIVYAYLPFMVLPLYARWRSSTGTCSRRRSISAPRRWRGVLHRHPAAVAAGHRRRLLLVLHPGGRRVRDPRPARRHADADDRQGALERVLHQPRLAARLGGGDLLLILLVGPIVIFQRHQPRRLERRP